MTVTIQSQILGNATTEESNVSGRTMGQFELSAYKSAWIAYYNFRRYWAATANRETVPVPDFGLPIAPSRDRNRPKRGDIFNAATIAAQLMFAKMLDEHPTLHKKLQCDAPAIIVDVPQIGWMAHLAPVWAVVMFGENLEVRSISDTYSSKFYDGLFLWVETSPKAKDKHANELAALSALRLAVPFIAISPSAVTHLPDAVLRAATIRLELPQLDSITIERTIRIVTGKRVRNGIEPALVAKISAADLTIAVRYDRTPSVCIAELRRLIDLKESKVRSRDVKLKDLHGLSEARGWAESTIIDVAAWKRGEIAWDAVSSSIALHGPPGTGKTLFAKAFASEIGFNLIAASLAKWQSSGDGHLGHLLREMYSDFNAARSQPSVVLIDEIDAFADRDSLKHSHRDYSIQVVNALLEQLDGIAGREGVIVIGASNNLGRCDPALLRAGRFDKIVVIDLPGVGELEQIFRVRLGSSLLEANLRPIAEISLGMTGADVESTVKDARRTARQAGRDLTLEDIQSALVPNDERPFELKWRICVHEAAHIVLDVHHFGPADIFATTALAGKRQGASFRVREERRPKTYEDCRKRLEVAFAGRAGEVLLLGAASDGAGGSSGSDLEFATKLAADMVASLGLLGSKFLTYFGPRGSLDEVLRFPEIRKAMAQELSEAEATCSSLVARKCTVIEAVAHHLFKVGRIEGHDVQRLIEEQNAQSRQEVTEVTLVN